MSGWELMEFLYGDHPKPKRPAGRIGKVTEVSSRTSRVLSNTHVQTLRADTVNGYHVTVNRHNGDDDDLQVLIDHPDYGRTIEKDVSAAELDAFIAWHTR